MGDFENDSEFENFNIGKETSNMYKQNPVCNGYYIIFELDDVLQSSYHDSSSRL